jgi:RNA polymerase sigma-70 factor (ECF subfamily)
VTVRATNCTHIGPEVIQRAFSGDSLAFRSIVERYQGPVYNLCFRFVQGADAEDLAQETVVRAFLNRSGFDLERPLLPWLLTIARRLCIDRARSRKYQLHDELDSERTAGDSILADDRLEQKEELALVATALGDLPEGQREAIVLHYVEGLAYKEVAAVLEVPIGTVMTWLHRGRAGLQARVGEMTSDRSGAVNGGGR